MERLFTKQIEEWFFKKDKKPMMVFGARQVGKSYIIDQFCRNCGKKYYKFDLLERPETISFFKNNINMKEAITTFALANNINLTADDIILFFDEVQESEEIIQSLKYFNLNYPNIDIITAGSLLGVALKRLEKSFPLGYVEEYNLYPLNFQEFLIATGNERFIPIIEESFRKNEPVDNTIHELLLYTYRRYLMIGGMPKIVQNYLDNDQEITNLNFNIQKDIVNEYSRDSSKYSKDEREKMQINRIYNHIISQLSKENPKFTYAKIDDKDNRKSDYVSALDWLVSSSIILKCNQVVKPEMPLIAYEDENSYKIYMNDVGLLSFKADINKGIILMDGDYSFKGRIAENYVACELVSNQIKLLYFSKKNENNNGMEIDFLIQNKDGVIPIEVKAGDYTYAKSLQSYSNQFKPKYSIRISTKNFGFENNIKSVPLYATFCIKSDN